MNLSDRVKAFAQAVGAKLESLGAFVASYSSPVAGQTIGSDWLIDDPTFPLAPEGGIWSGSTRVSHGIAKTFSVTDGSVGAPCAAFFAFASFDTSGNVVLNAGGTVNFNSSLSTSSAAGGAATLPANPVGFLTVNIGGTARKIPYYA